MEGRI